jgi:hypothetical protein
MGANGARAGASVRGRRCGLLTGFALERMNAVGAMMTSAPVLGMSLQLVGGPSFALAAFAVGLIGVQQGSEIDLLA